LRIGRTRRATGSVGAVRDWSAAGNGNGERFWLRSPLGVQHRTVKLAVPPDVGVPLIFRCSVPGESSGQRPTVIDQNTGTAVDCGETHGIGTPTVPLVNVGAVLIVARHNIDQNGFVSEPPETVGDFDTRIERSGSRGVSADGSRAAQSEPARQSTRSHCPGVADGATRRAQRLRVTGADLNRCQCSTGGEMVGAELMVSAKRLRSKTTACVSAFAVKLNVPMPWCATESPTGTERHACGQRTAAYLTRCIREYRRRAQRLVR